MKIIIKKIINKIAHFCYLRRNSFSKLCVKEAVVAVVFMFELKKYQIFGPGNDICCCHLIALQSGISNAICNLIW